MVRTAYHSMAETTNPDNHYLQHQHIRHVDDQGNLLRTDSTFVDISRQVFAESSQYYYRPFNRQPWPTLEFKQAFSPTVFSYGAVH